MVLVDKDPVIGILHQDAVFLFRGLEPVLHLFYGSEITKDAYPCNRLACVIYIGGG